MALKLTKSTVNPECLNPDYSGFHVPKFIYGKLSRMQYSEDVELIEFKALAKRPKNAEPIKEINANIQGPFRIDNHEYNNIIVHVDYNVGSNCLCEIKPGIFISLPLASIINTIAQKNYEHISESKIKLVVPHKFVKTPQDLVLCDTEHTIYKEALRNSMLVQNPKPIESLKIGGVYLSPTGGLYMLLGFGSTIHLTHKHKFKNTLSVHDITKFTSFHGREPLARHHEIPTKFERVDDDFKFSSNDIEYVSVWLKCPKPVSISKLQQEYALKKWTNQPLEILNAIMIKKGNVPFELYENSLPLIEINYQHEIMEIRQKVVQHTIKALKGIAKNNPKFIGTQPCVEFIRTYSLFFNMVPLGMDPYIDPEIENIIGQYLN